MRFVLEGSVQPSGNQVRVNAQLIDADSGAHLWADQFDTPRGDLLQMQDEIVARLAHALEFKALRSLQPPDSNGRRGKSHRRGFGSPMLWILAEKRIHRRRS